MRLLTVTSLYPNAEQPNRGVFVRERLWRMQQYHNVTATVIAPVPWFPWRSPRFGAYSTFARVPRKESTSGGDVYHPRYLQVPRIGNFASPLSFARSLVRETTRWDIGCDVVDAHFLFPDGVAAVLAAARLGRPVVLTARGSDVNIIAEEPLAGRWIRWAVQRADRLVAVSNDLGERLQALAPGRTVEVICNGVDTDRFRPCDRRTMLRASLGVTDFTVLSVGNLVPLKGHDVVIDAVARLPAVRLIIVGDGPLRSQLAARARALGIADRVHLTGSLPQEDLAKFYAAADVLALASSHEGLPNVVLESLASGTPVIATPTGGAREVLEGCDAGILAERDARAFADGIRQFMLRRPAPENVRSQIARFDWRHCAQRLHDVFSDVAA